MLLIPEVVELDRRDLRARCSARAGELAALGLVLEPFGAGAVCLRETPALLGEVDARGAARATSPTTSPRTRAAAWRRGSTRCCRAWPATARCAPAGGCAPRR